MPISSLKPLRCLFVFTLLVMGSLPSKAWADRVSIPGTGVKIDLPTGFGVADGFTGLYHEESGSSVVIAEFPAPAAKMAEEMFGEKAAAGMKQQGITLDKRETLKDGSILASGKQQKNGVLVGKLIRVFGSSQLAVMATANIVEPKLQPALYASLAGATYESRQQSDLLAGLNFTFTNFTDLPAQQRVIGSILFAKEKPAEGRRLSQMMLLGFDPLSVAQPAVPHRKAHFTTRARNAAECVDCELHQLEEVQLSGVSGYSAQLMNADGTHIYFMMTFGERGNFFAVGRTDSKSEADAKDFLDKVTRSAKSIRPKS